MAKTKSKVIIIVESPAKLKTLSKILGNGYEIKASYGHIRDLPRTRFGIDVEHDFKPTYKIMRGRAKTVFKEIKQTINKSDRIILATDPDREGEAIAWHLAESLKIPPDRVERITFNEITPPAVLEAVKNPRKISMDLVNAQQSRRLLDRIVGYKLSPLLWKKIARGLSAGRVQSVAVKLLVDREKEIAEFKPQDYWKINADFQIDRQSESNQFNTFLHKINDDQLGNPLEKSTDIFISSEAEVKKLTTFLESANFNVSKITERETNQNPPPPFITSTLQQQAVNQLGFSTKKTMMIAQQLYEGVEISGEPTALITYMRTDSVRISDVAIATCRDFIANRYGTNFINKMFRQYKSRKTAQDAHEAIRPTYVEKTPEAIKDYLTPAQYRLYKLIWQRFVATQMMPARWKSKTIEIESIPSKLLELEIIRVNKDKGFIAELINVNKAIFKTDERKLLFQGFLTLYSFEESLLPLLRESEKVNLIKFSTNQSFTQPPPRYTEASLVKTLEKFGIGRPSTYAPIISTIQDRGYARKNERQLVPTELGILIIGKLLPYFKNIINTKFSSEMEKQLDEIEIGKCDWIAALKRFYDYFIRDLEKATNEMISEKGKESVGGEKCDKCGKPMVERWGRYGKFIACSGYPECKNIISTKTQEETQPTNMNCEKCGKPMIIKRNKRGRRFLACSGYPDCKNAKPFKMTQVNEAENSSETTDLTSKNEE